MKKQQPSTKKINIPAKFKTKPYLVVVGAVAVVLGLVGTAYASNGSKPGDVLYSIDTTSEKLQGLAAFTPERKADLTLSLASERVIETEAILEAADFQAADLATALNGLTEQKKALADLVAAKAELKQQAKAYEDQFEQREDSLDAIFREAEGRLEVQEKALKVQLGQAQIANNTDEVARIRAALTILETRIDALEAEKEAAEEALEAEEERLEAEFEAREEALEAEEEAREEEIERLEEAAEAARERADEANETEKERLEQEAEEAEEAEEQAREAEEAEAEEDEQAEDDD